MSYNFSSYSLRIAIFYSFNFLYSSISNVLINDSNSNFAYYYSLSKLSYSYSKIYYSLFICSNFDAITLFLSSSMFSNFYVNS